MNIVNDGVVQCGCSFEEPMFAKIECPACKSIQWVSIQMIPNGEIYECVCHNCRMLLKRKKCGMESLDSITRELKILVESSGCAKYKNLPTADGYFNKLGLCGVVYEEGNKKPWVFVHQEYPEPGDNPNFYLFKKQFPSYQELFDFVSKVIQKC